MGATHVPYQGVAQAIAHDASRGKIVAIDDRKAKPARRHGMLLGGPGLVERYLDTRDVRLRRQPPHQFGGRMAITGPFRTKQHDAVAGAARRLVKAPALFRIEPDQRTHPTLTAV